MLVLIILTLNIFTVPGRSLGSLASWQQQTALDLIKQLQDCANSLGSESANNKIKKASDSSPPYKAAREVASIAVARLFLNHSYIDASRPGQNFLAKSVAAFRGKSSPNASDFAAASLVPTMELNDTVSFLETALQECDAVRNQSLRRPEGRLPTGPLRVDPVTGFLKDSQGKTAFIYGYSQQPDLMTTEQSSLGRALAMTFAGATSIILNPTPYALNHIYHPTP